MQLTDVRTVNEENASRGVEFIFADAVVGTVVLGAQDGHSQPHL